MRFSSEIIIFKLTSEKAKKNQMNQEDRSDEYPIVWFEPNIDSEENWGLKRTIQKNKSIVFFSETGKMLESRKSINTSFLLVSSTEELLREFDENLYHRRLADFEEEIVLTRFLQDIPANRSFRVYVFYTRKDFEEEIITKEEAEEVMRPSEVKINNTIRVFCEEFLSWDQNPKGELSLPGKCEGENEAILEKDFLECKEWCIRELKKLVFKRKREKIKMFYYVAFAENCRQLGEDKESFEYYERVLAVFQEVYGEGHPSTASLYRILGFLHSGANNNQKAQEFHAKALEIRKAIYGEIHYLTADSYAWYGVEFKELGQPQKALEYLFKCLEIEKAVFGEMHSYIANTYLSIGDVYENLQEHQKALESYLKALDIQKSVYGERLHYTIVSSYNGLGSVYESLGEHENAIEYRMKALEIKKSIYGESSVRVTESLHDLAGAYRKFREYEKALECYFEAIEIRKRNNQEKDLWSAAIYNGTGLTFYLLQEYPKAIENFAKALDIKKSIDDGETHSQTLLIYTKNLATAYYCGREYQQSLKHYLKALDIAKSLHGEISSETENVYRNIADTYRILHKYEESAHYSVKSLGVSICLNGEMTLEIVGTCFNIANEYSHLFKREKAFDYGLKGLSIQRFIQGEDHPATEGTYLGLESLYLNLNNQQKELVCDKKSFTMENSLSKELAARFRTVMRDEKVSEVNKNLIDQDDSLLGKRGASSENSDDRENSEPEVGKKIKQ